MNRLELIDKVHSKVQEQTRRATVPKIWVERSVNAVMDEIKKALVEGDNVQLPGFGTFEAVDRAERIGRNPQTGEEVIIPAQKAVKFKAGQPFKDAVNKDR